MTDTPTLDARTVGVTENALRALLVKTMRGTGLDYYDWVVLTLVARSGPAATETEVTRQLVDGLKIDEAAVSGRAARSRGARPHRPQRRGRLDHIERRVGVRAAQR